MTVYHASGTLYFLSQYVSQTTTFKNAITSRKNTGAAFYYGRTTNLITSETLPDGTIRVDFFVCFTSKADRDYVVNLKTTTVSNRLNLKYCSHIETHTCPQDTDVTKGFGVTNSVYTTWGACG